MNSSYLELKGNTYYVKLTIPKKSRQHLGKFRYYKSLKTSDRKTAERRALPHIYKWKTEISNTNLYLEKYPQEDVRLDALHYREVLNGAESGNDLDAVESISHVITDRADKICDTRNYTQAKEFADIAFGVVVYATDYIDDWVKQLRCDPKTVDMMRTDVWRFFKLYPNVNALEYSHVRAWVDGEFANGISIKTLQRRITFFRNFWHYLGIMKIITPREFPFGRKDFGYSREKLDKAANKNKWLPFEATEVVRLWHSAKDAGDDQLADLIVLGAYTGCRIEELCSLKKAQISNGVISIDDAKTSSGSRNIPIHKHIAGLINRLTHESHDEYLLGGLTLNKYGDRSNAIGKRFGRLKASLGFGTKYVFHSLRKSFVTLCENAGISENVCADLVGHKKPRMTYGHYSGGNKLPTLTEAMNRIEYPFTEDEVKSNFA